MSKKILTIVTVLVICFLSFSACSQTENQDEKCYDQEFLSSFVTGLCNRWDITEKKDKDITEDKTVEYYNIIIDKELNEIKDYTNKKFNDTNLQEKAITYINLLNDQKEALKYYNADYEKFSQLWETAYDKRTQLILNLIETYHLSFSEKYQITVDELSDNAKVISEKENFEEETQKITDKLKFRKISSEYGYTTYSAIMKNTTNKKFTTVIIDISLLDKNGTIIENTSATVSNVSPSQKAKLKFETDISFSSYELNGTYYTD